MWGGSLGSLSFRYKDPISAGNLQRFQNPLRLGWAGCSSVCDISSCWDALVLGKARHLDDSPEDSVVHPISSDWFLRLGRLFNRNISKASDRASDGGEPQMKKILVAFLICIGVVFWRLIGYAGIARKQFAGNTFLLQLFRFTGAGVFITVICFLGGGGWHTFKSGRVNLGAALLRGLQGCGCRLFSASLSVSHPHPETARTSTFIRFPFPPPISNF